LSSGFDSEALPYLGPTALLFSYSGSLQALKQKKSAKPFGDSDRLEVALGAE